VEPGDLLPPPKVQDNVVSVDEQGRHRLSIKAVTA
jgi:predicted RNA-binding protein with RPS1 domain